MNLQEISAAVDRGDTVHWQSTDYIVTKGPSHPDNPGNGCNPALRYLITGIYDGGHSIGLTWTDGVTLNGKDEDFFISSPAVSPSGTSSS